MRRGKSHFTGRFLDLPAGNPNLSPAPSNAVPEKRFHRQRRRDATRESELTGSILDSGMEKAVFSLAFSIPVRRI
jgi:hypothetical protein